jgi:ribonuclease P protein subunit RPR2
LLVESKTSRSWIENPSKGGRKPWADILVIECGTCGNAKRYPVDAPRQKRRSLRSENQTALAGQDEVVKDDIT